MEPSKKQQRNDKIANIRQSLKAAPVIRKATLQVESKLQKMRVRKKSACLVDILFDKELADSVSDNESKEENPSLFNDLYTLGEKIGEGAHGVVKKCYCKETGQLLAVKTIQMDLEHTLYLKQNFIDIKNLKHPNIIRYKAIFFEMKHERCHLVMDYLPFPDLLSIAIKTEQQLKQLTHQVLLTLAFLHSQKICHRDIKPENILYDQANKRVILIDFGISRKLIKRGIKRQMLTLTGTPYYRAPEMFQGGGYDELVDMWALGVTIFKLMSGATPFESEYHSDTISNIVRGQFIFPPSVEARFSRQARVFVGRLLRRRTERISSKEALQDLWFIDLQKKYDENTRSMTMNANLNRLLFTASHHIPILQRNNTSSEEKVNVIGEKSKQEVIKTLKSLNEFVEEQDSMIYGCEEDPPAKSLFNSPI